MLQRFRDFIEIWNKSHYLSTPQIHIEIANWLEKSWRGQRTKLILNAFRGAGKSTITSLFVAWLIYRNANTRILILSANEDLAIKMLVLTRKIIETHILFQAIKVSKGGEWSKYAFTVSRSLPTRDPSVVAAGMNSNITGFRADVIICDDVEVPKTCQTRSNHLKLKEKLSELDFILVPDGMILYLGTPHIKKSIYNLEEKDCILSGFDKLVIPLLNQDNMSNWPEMFSLKRVYSIKKQQGLAKFASQMMLEFHDNKKSKFSTDLINYYQEDLKYKEANDDAILKLGDTTLLSASCAWDPAFAKEKNCASVISCVYTDDNGNYYLHDIEYISVPTDHQSPAKYQCLAVAKFLTKNYLPSVIVEDNGLGKFLPSLLLSELRSLGMSQAVIAKNSYLSKDIRILSAFEPLLLARKLFINKKLIDSPFFSELESFDKTTKSSFDGLDSVALAIKSEPIRLRHKNYNQLFLQPKWQYRTYQMKKPIIN